MYAGVGTEGENDISAIDMSDLAVVIVGDEERTDEEWTKSGRRERQGRGKRGRRMGYCWMHNGL